jgi:integrase
MVVRKINTLTVKALPGLPPGRHCDGHNLYAEVAPSGSRAWIFRFKSPVTGKVRQMGLGMVGQGIPAADGRARVAGLPLGGVTLAEARIRAAELLSQVRAGVDPLEARKEAEARQTAEAKAAKLAGITFREVAAQWLAKELPSLSNAKHRAQVASTLETYAYPVLGDLPVASIGLAEVKAVLDPIWLAKTETAKRLRGRVEGVLTFATVHGWRQGDNPARWGGLLEQVYPAKGDIARERPQPALPWQQMPDFWTAIAGMTSVAAHCLRFQILTAARPGEAARARWGQIDLAAKVWNRPAELMKARQFHAVPLSDAAMAELAAVAGLGRDPARHVFPGQGRRRKGEPTAPLSDAAVGAAIKRLNGLAPRWVDPKQGGRPVVPHGFRSTFSDWARAAGKYDNDAIEGALAHAVPGTKGAYFRGGLLEARLALMADWAAFVTTGSAPE